MLKLLKIKNIALSASVELEFGPGLTLLTGETGAGKSLVVDALGLAPRCPRRRRTDPHRREDRDRGSRVRRAWNRRRFSRRTASRWTATRSSCAASCGAAGRVARCRQRRAGSRRRRCASWRRPSPPSTASTSPQGLLDPRQPPRAPRRARRAPRRAWPPSARRTATCARSRQRSNRSARPARGRAPAGDARVPGRRDRAARRSSQARTRSSPARRLVQANAGRLAGLSSEAYALLYEDEDAVARRGSASIYRKVRNSRARPAVRATPRGRAAVHGPARRPGALPARLPGHARRRPRPARRDRVAARAHRAPEAQLRRPLVDGPRVRASAAATSCALVAVARGDAGAPREARADGRQRYRALAAALSAKRRKAARDLEKRV